MSDKHRRVYDQLIARAVMRKTVEGYKERHHILPKSLGGDDSSENIVELTAREHFIAHCLLARIYGGTQWLPVLHFKGANKAYFSSRLYETARLSVSKMKLGSVPWNKGSVGGKWTEARREAQKYIVHPGFSEETRKKYCGKKSPEHAEAIRKAKLNQSVETRSKISAAKRGSTHSDESKRKMSEAKIGSVQSKESIDKRFFAIRCKSLNKLINSVFEPVAA